MATVAGSTARGEGLSSRTPSGEDLCSHKPSGEGTLQGADSSTGATILGFHTGLPGWVAVPLFVLVWLAATYLVSKAIKKYFGRLALLTGQKTYELALASQRLPLIILFLLLGAKIALDSSAFSSEFRGYGNFTLATLVVVTLMMAVVRIGTAILFEIGATKASFRPLVGPMRFVIVLFVAIVGAILWMEAVGIPVTPVVATFGFVGLAAGLALSDTLANLFAGMHIILDRRVRVGDCIRIEGGPEGFVQSIGWRSTRLVNTENDLVTVPNRKLAESAVTNFSLPEASTVALVEIPISIHDDVRRVLGVLQETVRESVKKISGAVPDQIPLVRLSDLSAQGATFQVGVVIKNALDRPNVKSELWLAALEALREEGVEPWGEPGRAKSPDTRKKR